MQKCTAPPYKPVQACIKSFWLQKRLSHFSSVIAVHVSSSDTLEHDRKQAHAFYPSELSIFKTGCWLSTFFLSFFLSVLYKIFKQPSASSLGVLESYFFVFLAVFFLLHSSLNWENSILLLRILLVDKATACCACADSTCILVAKQ